MKVFYGSISSKTGDLVICTNNDCSLVNSGNSTPGYYITKNDSYVQCRNYGYCEKINNMSIPSNCNENNIGKLVEVNNEIKLCLEDYVALVTDGKLLKITMDVQIYDKVVFFLNVLDIP
ncbi:hypothetical protein LY90DRAFT_517277 [Neocallimastix californiae]|uniref:Uncharacterized protein n=1 Tax=Neocallimastix californiae TaxID=1754190 RepID=A0A1Y2AAP2_9FUNG|nr:hypothetical protein LY90DRAFT_517277 [Neocallimastix californiae]|eukprot:ORY19360.1 hypothetical protein LY90DRAFT_517277 [Neocallimastix californiae]